MNIPDQPTLGSQPTSAGYTKVAFSAIASAARGTLRSARVFALAVSTAALWIWGWTLWPFDFERWWSVVLAVAFLVFLLTPPVVLWVFVIGLRQLANLPAELRGKTAEGRELLSRVGADLAGRELQSKRRLTFRLGKSAYALWALILDSKGMLLQYAGLVRLANPFSVLIGLAAAGAGAILLAFAGITFLWWIIVTIGG